MTIRPDTESPDFLRGRLIEVSASELPDLADYSWQLWRAAYEPHLFTSEASRLLWSRSYSIEGLEFAMSAGEKIFWVTMGGKRAGFVAYRLNGVNRLMRLSKLYLHPDYWGRGLGGWVLRSVSAAAIGAGAEGMDLFVFRQNLRAIKAYQRAGFSVAREELTDLGGGVIYDDLVMVKELP